MAFHVYRLTAQETTLDKASHASGGMAKLIVMAYCNLALPFSGKRDQG
jgi:hypothetical protein